MTPSRFTEESGPYGSWKPGEDGPTRAAKSDQQHDLLQMERQNRRAGSVRSQEGAGV